MAFVESEIKLYVPDLSVVIMRLGALDAVCTVSRVFERNVRYENNERTFTQDGIVLRLRQDDRNRLTYKASAIQDDAGVSTRFEAETVIDDFEAMDMILRKLGFTPYIIYEKYRTTYHYGDVEVVLDEMPYGNFVEIEGQPPHIMAAMDTLQLTEAPRMDVNYLGLLDRVKSYLKRDIPNLTFANFEALTVPLAAFLPEDSV
jgi:adenylate cyclase, class 2